MYFLVFYHAFAPKNHGFIGGKMIMTDCKCYRLSLSVCICAVAISLVFASQVFAAIDPASAYLVWTFEEASGNTVEDESGNGNNGEFVGNTTLSDGKTGDGVMLDGSNSAIRCDTVNGVENKAFTECLWVNFAGFAAEAQFGYINCTGTTNGRFFYFSSWSSGGGDHNCIHAGVLDTAGAWGRGISTGRLFEEDTWYFVCAVIDTEAGFIKAYVDGQLVPGGEIGTGVGDVPGEPDQIWVGGSPESYQWVNGTVDDVAFFNVALSQEDINSVMNNGILEAIGLTAVDPSASLSTTWGGVKGE